MSVRFLSGVNVDQNTLFVDDVNNRVGIGTASPTSELDVRGNNMGITGVAPTVLIYSNTTSGGKIAFVDQNWSSQIVGDGGRLRFNIGGTTEAMRIDNNGNVGIGTTSPSQKLEVSGALVVGMTTPAPFWNALFKDFNDGSGIYISSVNGGGGKYIAGNAYYYNSLLWRSDKTVASAINLDNGTVVFYTNSGLTANTDFTPTERMRILSNGDVAIGATYSIDHLYVSKTAGSSIGIGTGGIAGTVASPLYTSLNFRGYGDYIKGQIQSYDVSSNAVGGLLTFSVQDTGATLTERMRITSAGNVGIGTTSPAYKLDVNVASNSDALRVQQAGASKFILNGDGVMTWGATAANGVLTWDTNIVYIGGLTNNALGIWAGGNEKIRITTGGNVGIGTTSPATRLDLGSTQGGGIQFLYDSSQVYRNGIYNYWNSGTDTRMDFNIGRTANVAPVTIMSVGYAGNVGIGTTTPAQKLHVVGNTTITGVTYTDVVQTYSGASIDFRHQDASVVMRVDTANARVGIGTTSPAFKLDINGASNSSPFRVLSTNTTSLRTFFEATSGNVEQHFLYTGNQDWVLGLDKADSNKFKLASADDGFASAKLTVTTSGNVGIGTTSPSEKLHVDGNGYFTSSVAIATGVGSPVGQLSLYANPGTGVTSSLITAQYSGNVLTSIQSYNAGSHYQDFIINTSNGSASPSLAEVFRIKGQTGNVGIGTTSPSEKLHVIGNTNVSGYVYTSTLYVNNTNGTAIVNAYSGGHIGTYLAKASSATANFTTTGVSYPRGLGFGAIIGQGNTTDIPVNNASWNGGYGGNIGFWSDVHYGVEGGTNSIGFNAVIKGSGESYSYGFFSDLSGVSAGTRYGIYTKGEQQNYFSGNVGIGTTSPVSKLNINNGDAWINVTDTLRGLQFGYAGPSHGSYRAAVMGGAESYGGTDSGMLTFHTQNGYVVSAIPPERMRITSDGNVLIGTTTNSGEKLFVQGAGRFVNQLRAYNLLSDNQIKGSAYVELSPDQTTYNAWNIRVGAQAADACYYITGGGVNILTTEGYNNPYTVKLYSNGVQTLTMTNGSVRLNTYGSGSKTGTVAYNLAVDASGNIIELPGGVVDGSGTANYVSKWSDANTLTNSVLYDDGTDVGIGTTSPAPYIDGAAARGLQINNAGRAGIRLHDTGGVVQYFDIGINGSTAFISAIYSQTPTIKYQAYSEHIFEANSSERMRITSAGNVGIGTTSPAGKLHIADDGPNALIIGDTQVSTIGETNNGGYPGMKIVPYNSNIHIGISSTTDNKINLWYGGQNYTYWQQLETYSVISNYSTSALVLQVNGGNVGIGTTSPATKLHVVGYSRNDGGLLLNGSDADYREMIFTTSSAARWNLYAYGGEGGSNAGSVLYLARYADNGDYIANVATFLRTNGYVGIATTTPTQQLHVSGNVRVTGAYYDSSNSAGSSGQVLSSTGSGTDWVSLSEITGVDGTGTANYIAKWSDADTIANSQIRDDGTTVGIGVAPGAAKLTVSGSITGGGQTVYNKSYASLDTTGVAIAGLNSSTNGQSALFTFTCYGGDNHYQRVVYSCKNDSGSWYTSKVVDEGTNGLDVTASADGATITFTYKARSATQGYSPRILIEHLGSALNTSYL